MAKDAKALVPGRTLEIDGHEITVFPAGICHSGKLFTKVVGVLQSAAEMKARPGESVRDHGDRVVNDMIPFAIRNALDIIKDCVELPNRADFDRLPHYFLPPIAQAWIEESFGEEKKWRPWLALVEEAATRLNGGKPIQMSEIWSKALSLLASASATSSSAAGQESRTAG